MTTVAAGAAFLSLARAQQTPAANPKKTPSSAQRAESSAAQKYRAVTEEDALSCSFSQDATPTPGGEVILSGNHFTCLDKANKEVEIELISRNPNVNVVPKGGKIGIRTKRFGTIYRGNEPGTLHTYEMTDTQIKQLKAFLATHAAKPNAPQAAASGMQQAAPATTASLFLGTPKDKVSYAIGMNVGKRLENDLKQLKQGDTEVDTEILVRAIKDALNGSKTLMTDQEAQTTLTTLQADLRKRQEEKQKLLAETNKKESEEFLAANRAKEGVVSLTSGLQYKILQEGTGPKPEGGDMVTVNYRGTLLNGTEFDSSYKRGQPATFGVGGVIKGWTEALQLMPLGSKWQLFIPPGLAYGARGAGPNIGPNSTLVFEVELVSIQPKTQTVPVPAPTPGSAPGAAPTPTANPATAPTPTPTQKP